jgi:glycosyltransferase involved in cell wall biosynthesis
VSVDVSVVVPVYNPGANLEPCLQSLLGQTLDASRYELVLVDDGSTDGTASLLDHWAAREPGRIVVVHEPNSGWPGRPRNIGVARARGDYVQFVDNDDLLAPHALERMVELARECDADVVLGKMSSDFRGINHDVFRSTAVGVTWRDFPLHESLTPHKMFRREFLREHDIRFAEGPLHLEDQLFCMHAYVHASSAAVVGDEQCYFYKRRNGFGRNAGDIAADPDDYYRDLERVLDVIDVHVQPEERRRLYERFFRVEMLGRLRDQAMLDYDDDYRRHLFHRVRRLAEERMPRIVDDLLPSFPRRQAELLRSRDLDGMVALAAEIAALRVEAQVSALSWQHGVLQLDVEMSLPVASDQTDLILVARDDAATWFVADTLDPSTALAGAPLRPGLWDLRLRARLGGITRTARLDIDPDLALPTCLYDGPPRVVTPYRTAAGGLALDVDEWARSLTSTFAATAGRVNGRTWRSHDVVAADVVRRDAAVLAEGRRITANLLVTADGATLTASVEAPAAAHVRVGDPGRSEPRPLPDSERT